MAKKKQGTRKPRSGNKNPRYEHLKYYQWKQGQSGNPNGRPKNDAAAALCRAIIETSEPELYERVRKFLLKGKKLDGTLLKTLFDRGYGRLRQVVDLGGEGGEGANAPVLTVQFLPKPAKKQELTDDKIREDKTKEKDKKK